MAVAVRSFDWQLNHVFLLRVVMTVSGKTTEYVMLRGALVRELKGRLCKDQKIKVEMQIIMFKGQVLEDTKPLNYYGVTNESTLLLIPRMEYQRFCAHDVPEGDFFDKFLKFIAKCQEEVEAFLTAAEEDEIAIIVDALQDVKIEYTAEDRVKDYTVEKILEKWYKTNNIPPPPKPEVKVELSFPVRYIEVTCHNAESAALPGKSDCKVQDHEQSTSEGNDGQLPGSTRAIKKVLIPVRSRKQSTVAKPKTRYGRFTSGIINLIGFEAFKDLLEILNFNEIAKGRIASRIRFLEELSQLYNACQISAHILQGLPEDLTPQESSGTAYAETTVMQKDNDADIQFCLTETVSVISTDNSVMEAMSAIQKDAHDSKKGKGQFYLSDSMSVNDEGNYHKADNPHKSPQPNKADQTESPLSEHLLNNETAEKSIAAVDTDNSEMEACNDAENNEEKERENSLLDSQRAEGEKGIEMVETQVTACGVHNPSLPQQLEDTQNVSQDKRKATRKILRNPILILPSNFYKINVAAESNGFTNYASFSIKGNPQVDENGTRWIFNPLEAFVIKPITKKIAENECAQDGCHSKLKITEINTCLCKQEYCLRHSYPEAHNCTYDYTGGGRQF